jgi:hypothetical protein
VYCNRDRRAPSIAAASSSRKFALVAGAPMMRRSLATTMRDMHTSHNVPPSVPAARGASKRGVMGKNAGIDGWLRRQISYGGIERDATAPLASWPTQPFSTKRGDRPRKSPPLAPSGKPERAHSPFRQASQLPNQVHRARHLLLHQDRRPCSLNNRRAPSIKTANGGITHWSPDREILLRRTLRGRATLTREFRQSKHQISLRG